MAANQLAGSKPLDFDAIAAEEAKKMKHLADWPVWVQQGLGYVTQALAAVGITVDFATIKDPVEYVDQVIALVKASPSTTFTKWLALAALEYLRKNVEPAKMLSGFQGA